MNIYGHQGFLINTSATMKTELSIIVNGLNPGVSVEILRYRPGESSL